MDQLFHFHSDPNALTSLITLGGPTTFVEAADRKRYWAEYGTITSFYGTDSGKRALIYAAPSSADAHLNGRLAIVVRQ